MPHEVAEYDNAVKRLNRFFIGKRNVRVELEVFRSIKQKSEESFNKFILRLREQAARCGFHEREDSEILHQITIGARDEKVKDKGLENVMNLNEITNYANNRELLMKQKEKAKPFREELGVNYVPKGGNNQADFEGLGFRDRRSQADYKRSTFRGGRFSSGPSYSQARGQGSRRNMHWSHGAAECKGCGSFRHNTGSRECNARDARCNGCGEKGHFIRKCSVNRSGQQRALRPTWMSSGQKKEANFLSDGAVEWKEELPRRPQPEDIAKV